MELKTKRLYFQPISIEDLDNIHQLHSFPETDQFNTLGIPANIEETEQLLTGWIESQKLEPRLSYIFCLRLVDTKQFIGLVALNLGKLNYRIAEVWYKTHPAFWGNGYATEALQALLQFGFSTLDLHRIEAGCAVENIASVKVLEKVGMTREGRKRKILPIRGEWTDNYIYAILEEDHSK